jgi:hypothetical protein
MSTAVPHFAYPLAFAPVGQRHAAVFEQDSLDEIVSCCWVLLVTPLGYRPERPDVGMEELTFAGPGVDRDSILDRLNAQEPRADTLTAEALDALDELVTHVLVQVGAVTETP